MNQLDHAGDASAPASLSTREPCGASTSHNSASDLTEISDEGGDQWQRDHWDQDNTHENVTDLAVSNAEDDVIDLTQDDHDDSHASVPRGKK